MSEILTSLSDPRLVPALEANMEEEMLGFGRVLEGAEIYDDGEIAGFYTGRAGLNGVLRAHLKTADPAEVQAHIRRVLAYFRERGTSRIGWSVGQDSQPADLAEHLKREGFHLQVEDNVGLALDIAGMHVEEVPVADLEIRELTTVDDLRLIHKMECEGFGSTESMADNYCEMYEKSGFGPGHAWRHFCGWWRGEPVSVTSLLFYAGVAGIYGVTTVPHARQHGIARALVLQALSCAHQEGFRIAILSPTDMSEGIYRRLGFRPYTRLLHYRKEFE